MKADTLEVTVDGTAVRLSFLQKDGALAPLVCLHGFGSTKEDYADLAMHPAFQDRPLLFWDAPGCGASEVADPDAFSRKLVT